MVGMVRDPRRVDWGRFPRRAARRYCLRSAVAAFGDAVCANGFGVGLSPGVGAQGGVVGFDDKQAIENISDYRVA